MHVRRLVGPTVISLVLCILLTDYLFLDESRWSVVRFLGACVSILAGILTSPYNAGVYTWIRSLWFPLSLGLLALVLLRIMVSGAKRAMSEVSPAMTHEFDDLPRRSTHGQPILTGRPGKPIVQPYGLPWKLLRALSAVAILFGSVTCGIVYKFLDLAIERHDQDRAGIMAFGLSELVMPALRNGRKAEVNAVVASYAIREKVAYLYVEDHDGRMIAHWPADLPRYLRRDFPHSSTRALMGTIVDYRGTSLYAVAKRIDQGRTGFVHVAVEQGSIQGATREVVVNLALTITVLVVLCGITLFVWSAGVIQRPWSELINHANRISTGDFSGALPLDREDEFGDIARSLERLRSSLHAATVRFSAR